MVVDLIGSGRFLRVAILPLLLAAVVSLTVANSETDPSLRGHSDDQGAQSPHGESLEGFGDRSVANAEDPQFVVSHELSNSQRQGLGGRALGLGAHGVGPTVGGEPGATSRQRDIDSANSVQPAPRIGRLIVSAPESRTTPERFAYAYRAETTSGGRYQDTLVIAHLVDSGFHAGLLNCREALTLAFSPCGRYLVAVSSAVRRFRGSTVAVYSLRHTSWLRQLGLLEISTDGAVELEWEASGEIRAKVARFDDVLEDGTTAIMRFRTFEVKARENDASVIIRELP